MSLLTLRYGGRLNWLTHMIQKIRLQYPDASLELTHDDQWRVIGAGKPQTRPDPDQAWRAVFYSLKEN